MILNEDGSGTNSCIRVGEVNLCDATCSRIGTLSFHVVTNHLILLSLMHRLHINKGRWGSVEIPEYDLDTDELVYRGKAGNEIRRERFEIETAPEEVGALVESLELTTEPAQIG